jgi:hypothetical protein
MVTGVLGMARTTYSTSVALLNTCAKGRCLAQYLRLLDS